jgi:hypothetical protein
LRSRTDARKKAPRFEVNGAGTAGLHNVGHSVQIQLSRLFRKINSRRRLRKRLATGFELLRGGPATGIEHSGPGASPANDQGAAAEFAEMQKQAGAGKAS